MTKPTKNTLPKNAKKRTLANRKDHTENEWSPLEALQIQVFDNAPGGMAVIGLDGTILACNRSAAEITGYPAEDLPGANTASFYQDPTDRDRLFDTLKNGEMVTNYELPIITAQGSVIWINLNANSVTYAGKPASLLSFTDITSIRSAHSKLQLDEIRFEKLYTISEMADQPESKILDFALDAITKVTDSRIGYIYFLNEHETELTLYAWLLDPQQKCTVSAAKDVYKVDDTGLWGDALRQRKPVITNDYENAPTKRGYPEGHVPITNHMNLPVFDNERIVLLAGVGNKNGDYTDEDTRQIGLIMDGTWRIIQRKRADEALMAAQEELEEKVRQRTAEVESVNEELAILNMRLTKKDREQAQALRALEESEQRFRTLFENNHSAMLVIRTETGQLVDANPAAVEFYGYSEEQLLAMNITDINTLSPEAISVEMEKALQEKRSYFCFRHILSNGETRDVEVFSGPVVIKGEQHLYSIVHDVTERKKAEEALVRYERIISSTPDMISLVGTDHTYQMVNDAYLNTFNKPREEIVGHHVSVIVGKPLYDSAVKQRLQRAFAGETLTVENWMDTSDDERFYLATTYHPVSINGNSVDYVSVESRDMTKLKKSEEALQATAERLDMATNAGNIGIWEWDLVTDEGHWDKKMYELYNVVPGEFESVYEGWRTRLHDEDLPDIERQLAECIEKKTLYDAEFRLVWPGGEIRSIKAAGYVQLDSGGMPIRMSGVNWDVTEQRRMETELRKLASTDPLTGASNRRQFMDRLTEELDRCKRYNTPMVLLSLDIDHFKDINDTYGHPAGDDVLKHLVELCTQTLRTTDVFGRVGGEEFLAALTQTSSVAGQRTAERLRRAIEQHAVKTHGQDVCYTISIGLTETREQDKEIESLLKRADEALYLAKNNGRNRIETL